MCLDGVGMLNKLSLATLHQDLKEKIELYTGLSCYDEVPFDKEPPYYFIEAIEKRTANNKRMWAEIFAVTIHAIAGPNADTAGVIHLIKNLEDSLTEEMDLSVPFAFLQQTEQSMQKIMIDETEKNHGVFAWKFKVAYGHKTKF